MNKYTFNFGITPSVPVEYSITVPPFHAVLRETTLALKVTADATDEQRMHEHANQVAHDLARSLCYELAESIEVEYQGRHVLRDTGQQSVSARVTFVIKPAPVSTEDSTDIDMRLASERRERERQATQRRIEDLTKREAADANLRDMLGHWSRYAADPEGRLHPLYDVLQVVERLYGGHKEAASALSMSAADLSELGRISNDPKVLNGRHPGRAQGPHRTATECEVKTCERVVRSMIENQRAKVTL
jgi:hypothetical protein